MYHIVDIMNCEWIRRRILGFGTAGLIGTLVASNELVHQSGPKGMLVNVLKDVNFEP